MDVLSTHIDDAPPRSPALALEVFAVALGLGLTSFGGPVAHIGYFERTYVRRRKWLTSDEFAGLVALCQLIPGPASSQLGYLIGLRRAGWAGAFAAWVGFTLPSAVLMFTFALFVPQFSGRFADACMHGLKLVAVVIVAQAILSMTRALCPDAARKSIAVLAAAVLLLIGLPGLQAPVLTGGALLGVMLCRNAPARRHAPPLPIGPVLGVFSLALMLTLMAGTGRDHSLLALAAIFYRSGALVFGGGHVVLPLLRAGLVPAGWLNDTTFLSGYGAAQAMPGPLFTFAAYLGAAVAPQHASVSTMALWSAAALGAIFLPGMLIAVAGLSVWNWVNRHAQARAALAGANAAVVGILGAAFCTPVCSSAILRPTDLAIAASGFVLLIRFRLPPVAIVAMCIAASIIVSARGAV